MTIILTFLPINIIFLYCYYLYNKAKGKNQDSMLYFFQFLAACLLGPFFLLLFLAFTFSKQIGTVFKNISNATFYYPSRFNEYCIDKFRKTLINRQKRKYVGRKITVIKNVIGERSPEYCVLDVELTWNDYCLAILTEKGYIKYVPLDRSLGLEVKK